MKAPSKLERARDWAVLIGSITLVMILIVVAFGFFGRTESTPVAPAPSAPIVPAANVDVSNVEDFVIDMPSRDGNRLNADGVEIPGNTEALRSQIAEQARRDPLTLFAFYMASPLGEARPLKNEAVLAEGGTIKDGNAFSKEGIRAYQEWLVLWETASIKAVSEIRFQAINTGVKGVRLTQSSGVGGYNKSGFNIAYRDVSGRITHQHSVLCRCTQPTFGEPIRWAPEGPTDSPLTPPKGGNPYPNFVREHQEAVPLPPRTPGYTPGNADRVREEQGRQPIGGTDPTPPGTPGVGSGGVTPPGQGRNPDGSLIVAQPPTILPPYQPPPLSEVGTGVPLPPKPN